MATTPCYTGEILNMYAPTAAFDSAYSLFREDSGHTLPTVRSFDTPEEAMIMCKHKEGYHEGLRMYIFAKNGKYCATYSPAPAPRIGYRMVGSKLV